MPKKTYQDQMRDSFMLTILSTVELCNILAKKHNVDMACPYTVGILMNIMAHAIEEDEDDNTSWWRILGSKNELKSKYPNAPDEQMALLESEGFSFEKREKKYLLGGDEE